jgi:hypothetical protein
MTHRFWSFVTKSDGCWLWTGRSLSHGYGQLWVDGKRWNAPRLAWTLTNGPIPEGQAVCHRCDTPACVRPDHLFLADQRANIEDMRQKGRGVNPPRHPGAKNVNAKFSDADIRKIRRRYAAGDSLRVLGRAYKVEHTTISMIVRRKTWAHVS